MRVMERIWLDFLLPEVRVEFLCSPGILPGLAILELQSDDGEGTWQLEVYSPSGPETPIKQMLTAKASTSEWIFFIPWNCSSESNQLVFSNTRAEVWSLFSWYLHLMFSVEIWRASIFDTENLWVQQRCTVPYKFRGGNEWEWLIFRCHDVLKGKVQDEIHKYIFPCTICMCSHEISVVKTFTPSLKFLCFILVVRWKNQLNV